MLAYWKVTGIDTCYSPTTFTGFTFSLFRMYYDIYFATLVCLSHTYCIKKNFAVILKTCHYVVILLCCLVLSLVAHIRNFQYCCVFVILICIDIIFMYMNQSLYASFFTEIVIFIISHSSFTYLCNLDFILFTFLLFSVQLCNSFLL